MVVQKVCTSHDSNSREKKGDGNNMTTNTKTGVPEAREALNRMKHEVASEIGVPLKQGYNGDLTSAQNGYVGGYMVKKMIEAQERQMAGK